MEVIITLVIYAAFIGVLWWFMMRPQRKEQKRLALMLSEMAVGDTVLTNCGFYGVIIDISEDVRKEIDCIYNAIAALTINNNTGRHNQRQKIGFKTGGD